MTVKVLPGQPFPLGATVAAGGVNFSIFSNCTGLELLLFDQPDSPRPSQTIQFDPRKNRTFYYWHVFVPGIGAGQTYAYRAYGAYAPERGLRFDPSKALLDPYARVIVNSENYDRESAKVLGKDNCAQALRAVVADPHTYDWEGDQPLQTPLARTVIYELHVDAFTRHPNSGVTPEKRGTYAGLIEKIPYLQQLGVTAVELLPIHEFDEQDAPPGLKNYWGYSTIGFFAPHQGYSSRPEPMGAMDEFRDLVKALHRAGIEVILDVVFNHTAESDHKGPTLSFRGLANQAYYILEPDPTYYSNYSGCGNTLKANHPMASRMIVDSLHYWVSEMHVDGFRFDLASVLSRDEMGHPIPNPPVLWVIETSPILAGTKVIAEAWDAAGLYQVGGWFVGTADRFAEWNGPYRDEVRSFIKGDTGTIKRLSDRILGSPDLYPRLDYEPSRSINFVTCHDGFTLNDLVSYNVKHNEANREDNRDGSNDNHSWNCGVEGPTDDPEIDALRLRQIKNCFTILLCSQGTPMLSMGDEVRRTQLGNNNTYCQGNELSWFDWSATERQAGLLRFVQGLIRFTQSLEIFRQESLLTVTYGSHEPHIVWHGVKLGEPDWSANSHSVAFSLRHPQQEEHLHIILNAHWQSLKFELPLLSGGERWHRIVDTSLPSPDDFCELKCAPPIGAEAYHAGPRSAVVLMVPTPATIRRQAVTASDREKLAAEMEVRQG
ncbi:glycogen debranching protein GlgX [Leptolyngbya sp. FACHB-261]|uniref:glycogen debranching protein GlgX n=1 Tax=Leptolyngbya sp. FACHB-261 TaxID=2692806 RepID=UPI001687CC00|nr:glycogen debranching protein GlgX [Leptolyngbya sp. FACHB-261]MBD2101930.1 glycogen debranching protein GlgX [Leptolyngbya sp. FACHB-261]